MIHPYAALFANKQATKSRGIVSNPSLQNQLSNHFKVQQKTGPNWHAWQRLLGVFAVLVAGASFVESVQSLFDPAASRYIVAILALLVRTVIVVVIGIWMFSQQQLRSTSRVEQRLGFALNVICMLLIVPANATMLFETNLASKIWYYGTATIAILQCFWISRCGFMRPAAFLFCTYFVLQVIATAAFGTEMGQIGTPITYYMLVIIAGLLVRWWFALIISICLPALMGFLGALGQLPIAPSMVETVMYITALTAASGIIALYTHALNTAMAESYQHATDLQQAQQALSQQNNQLLQQTHQLEDLRAQQQQLILQQEDQIEAAVQTLRQRSVELRRIQTPLIRLAHGVLVVPLIGSWDAERADTFLAELLKEIERKHVQTAILDLTGISASGTEVALMIQQIFAAAQLLGCDCVLVGIQPEIAQSLVALQFQPARLQSAVDLAEFTQHTLFKPTTAHTSSSRFHPTSR
jgi:rsbT co-antagonist protein RsbR